MTPQEQPKEYIITEDMIRWWRNQCIAEPAHTDNDQCKSCEFRGKGMREGCCDLGDSDFEKMFRSRPTPSHSECYKKGYADAVANALSQHADCVKCLEEDRVTMLEHDATIVAATLTTLSDELEFLPSSEDKQGIVWITMRDVREKIESLRSTIKEQHP